MTWQMTANGGRQFSMILHRPSDVGLLLSAEQAYYLTRALVATMPDNHDDRRLRQITLRGLAAA